MNGSATRDVNDNRRPMDRFLAICLGALVLCWLTTLLGFAIFAL